MNLKKIISVAGPDCVPMRRIYRGRRRLNKLEAKKLNVSVGLQ